MKKLLLFLLISSACFGQKKFVSELLAGKDTLGRSLILPSEKAAIATIPAKQDKYVTYLYTNEVNLNAVNGSTISGNVLTIPSGQSGNTSFFGLYMQSAADVSSITSVTSTITIVITNYTRLAQPVTFTTFSQRYKAGVNQGNTTPSSSSYTDVINGTTLTRTYTITQTYNQADSDNGYYYRYLVQLNSATVLSNPVTLTITGSMNITYEPAKVISVLNNEAVTVGLVNGATRSGNIVTIPVGQTGYTTYMGPQMPNANNIYVGQTIEAKITLTITNYTQLSPLQFLPLAQRFKAGVYQGNITPTEISFTDVVNGTTLIRTYLLRQLITQSDIDNAYYYYFFVQNRNLAAVSTAVTMTVVARLDYKIDVTRIVTKLNEAGAVNTNVVDKAIKNSQGQYSGYTVKTVKKDGTGDYLNIQAAIDGILDASLTNQYEILVYDDWYFTARSQLSGGAPGSTSQSWVFRNKDYVHVRGHGGIRKIEVQLPNNSVANDLIYTQTAWHSGYSRLENLHLIIKNGRYALHTEGAGVDDADDRQELINCILEHQGNQDASNFNSWRSDNAWGFGNSSGQKTYAKGCTFIARKQSITYHTNFVYANPTHLKLENCDLIEREPSRLDSAYASLAMNAAELGSGQKHTLELVGCNINNAISISGSWYTNTTKRDDARTLIWNIVGHGNSPISFKLGGINVLKLESVANNVRIYVKGGTAAGLIYGDIFRSKTGVVDMKGYTVGSISIEPGSNGYVTNYMTSLGHRLGDCSSVNKTLIVNVNGTDYTVTFDKNYSGGAVTSVPAYSNAQILTEINTALSGVATATDYYSEFFPQVSDMYAIVKNASTSESIKRGMGVVWDYTKGQSYVRKATNGEKIDGIALDDVFAGGNDFGKIMLKGKGLVEKWQLFAPFGYNPGYLSTDTIYGKMLKIGATAGSFVETLVPAEAVLFGVDKETWKFSN